MLKKLVLGLFLLGSINGSAQIIKKAIPDKLVVLTFDDAVLSHYTIVAPLLKKYKFGATFFIAEFLKPSFSDKTKYLSWEQIGELNKMGFEIGNHTQNHTHVNKMDSLHFTQELNYIEQKALAVHVKDQLVSFAYPGYDTAASAILMLKKKGYLFARSGGNRVYNPEKDLPFLIPSFTTANNNSKEIYDAFLQAKDGKIVVLTIHGVPDDVHPWVNTPLNLFEDYLKYLHANHYKVIALRDLEKYIDPEKAYQLLNPNLIKPK
jgi:peptidoglycan/xylan/chitin deacetylase (PgdA/CDA1 family)